MTSPAERSAQDTERHITDYMQRMDQVADELRQRQPETVTPGEIDAYQGELNDLCPYIGEQCQIAGNGQWPIFDSDGENIGEEWRYETGMIAESHGVAIERLDHDAYYRPYHKFYLGFAKRRDRATKESVFNNYALLDRMGSIVLKRTVDGVFSDDESRSIFIPADFDTDLQAHSDWFRSNLTSRAFRRRTLASQQQFVDNYLAFVTDKFKLERAGVSFVATYCLRAASLSVLDEQLEPLPEAASDPMNSYEYLSLRGEPEHRGMIRGFVSPERTRLYETQLRAMRDFVDPTAGLCLAIEMLKSYSHSRLRANDVILLPLSSQEYRLNFHEPIREWLTGAVS